MPKSRRQFIKRSAGMLTGSFILPEALLAEAHATALDPTPECPQEVDNIRLVVVMFDQPNFKGDKRTIVVDTPELGLQNFNRKAESVKIHAGPNHPNFPEVSVGGKGPAPPTHQHVDEPTVGFYDAPNYAGVPLVLTRGEYPHLPSAYRNIIGSVKFDPKPIPDTEPHLSVPLIVQMYEDPDLGGPYFVVVEDSTNITKDFGSEFDQISSVCVIKGPTFDSGPKTVQLHRHPNFCGGHITLVPGIYNLADFQFDNEPSSIKFTEDETDMCMP